MASKRTRSGQDGRQNYFIACEASMMLVVFPWTHAVLGILDVLKVQASSHVRGHERGTSDALSCVDLSRGHSFPDFGRLVGLLFIGDGG